jgi:hypothetical protein
MRIAMARFPFQKTLESFDFKFQPSLDPKQIRELATGRYIQSGDNLLLLGPPGVGKSHLAVALGIKACEQGVRTLFVTATALITTLGKALAEGKLDERLKLLTQPQLLICDEIGYLPIDRQGANLSFQLVSRRYERGSIIITSNQSLGAWGEVFGDNVIASQGEFKRSSQHLGRGSCDGYSKAPFRSMRASTVALTGVAWGSTAGELSAVLGSDCGGPFNRGRCYRRRSVGRRGWPVVPEGRRHDTFLCFAVFKAPVGSLSSVC